MRAELAKTSLAALATGMSQKGMPDSFTHQAQVWFADRQQAREEARLEALQERRANQQQQRACKA